MSDVTVSMASQNRRKAQEICDYCHNAFWSVRHHLGQSKACRTAQEETFRKALAEVDVDVRDDDSPEGHDDGLEDIVPDGGEVCGCVLSLRGTNSMSATGTDSHGGRFASK